MEESKGSAKDSPLLGLEQVMDASFDLLEPGLSVLVAGDLEAAGSKGSVKGLLPPDLGLVKDASHCSLLELGLSQSTARGVNCIESGFGAVKDLVEVADSEGPAAVKG